MTTLKEAAIGYVPRKAKTIAELPEVSIDVKILEATENKGKEDEYVYNYIDINGERYRVPDSVLKGIQSILKKKPNLSKFAVSKEGTGLNTEYTVIPMD